MAGGADSALDKIFGQPAEDGNQEVLNQQPVQARAPRAYAPPQSLMQSFPNPTDTQSTEVSPLDTVSGQSQEQGETGLGGQFAQAGKDILGFIGNAVDKIDAPTSMQYGSIVTLIKLLKGGELSDEENEFIGRYLEETKAPLTDMWNSPADFFKSIGAAIKGTWSPSEELKEAYDKSFDTKAKIGFSLGNPLWYALPGAAAMKGGRVVTKAGEEVLTGLAKQAAKGGVKGTAATVGQIALTPVADMEIALGKIISLPAKGIGKAIGKIGGAGRVTPEITQPVAIQGTGKLVNVLRAKGDVELANSVEGIVIRAHAGDIISPEELLAVTKQSPKVADELNKVLTNINLDRQLDELPEYSRMLWKNLTPGRRRAIARAANLSEDISSKAWNSLNDVEKSAINRIYRQPETKPVIDRVTTLFEDFPKYQGEQKFLRAEERAKRYAPFAEAVQKATTPEEMATASGLRAGKMPKVGMEAGITPDDAGELFQIIKESPVLQYRSHDLEILLTGPTRSTPEGGTIWKLSHKGADDLYTLPADHEIALLEEVLGKPFADSIRAFKEADNKAVSIFLDAINFPRAIQSALDLSNMFRQSGVLSIAMIWEHPSVFGKAFKDSLKSFAKQEGYDEVFRGIRAHPLYNFAKDPAGIALKETHLSVEGVRGLREEPFFSKFATWLPGIKQSARAFTAFSNSLRFGAVYKYLATRPQLWDKNELPWLGKMLNWETGRGPVPESWLPFLSGIMYSPSHQASRIAMPILLAKASPAVRQMAWRHFIQYVGSGAGIMAALKFSGAADIELDRRSTQFGKITVGNTHIDPWGGFLTYFRLADRLTEGQKKTSAGEIVDVDKWDEIIRGGEYKTAPIYGIIRQIVTGETMMGEELTLAPGDMPKQIFDNISPFMVRDIYDAMVQDGWTGVMAASSGLVGAGVVSYPSTTFANWLIAVEGSTGQDWDNEQIQAIRPLFEEAEGGWEEYVNLKGRRAKTQYRIDHPEIDASLFFWGEESDMANDKESRPLVQKMLDDNGLTWDILPVKLPEGPYDRQKKTDDQVVNQLLDFFPSDIAAYYMQNKDALYKDNLDDYVNMVQTMRVEDKRMVSQYELLTYDSNTQIKASNRAKYLMEHPDIDAARVLWDGTIKTLHSAAARQILLDKLAILGIPPEAIDISSGAVAVKSSVSSSSSGNDIRDKINKYLK